MNLEPLRIDTVASALPQLTALLEGTAPAWLPVPAHDPREAERLTGALAAGTPIDERVALVVATSGTTGTSKGAMLTHRNVFVNNVNMLYHLNLRPGHQYLHAIPMAHGNGWGCVWSVTAAGATHVMLRGP